MAGASPVDGSARYLLIFGGKRWFDKLYVAISNLGGSATFSTGRPQVGI